MPEITIDMNDEFGRIKPEFAPGQPRVISFCATPYTDRNGDAVQLTINVEIANGDVYGMLDAAVENGGIGGEDDNGVYRFIPWPCACVEVRDR